MTDQEFIDEVEQVHHTLERLCKQAKTYSNPVLSLRLLMAMNNARTAATHCLEDVEGLDKQALLFQCVEFLEMKDHEVVKCLKDTLATRRG